MTLARHLDTGAGASGAAGGGRRVSRADRRLADPVSACAFARVSDASASQTAPGGSAGGAAGAAAGGAAAAFADAVDGATSVGASARPAPVTPAPAWLDRSAPVNRTPLTAGRAGEPLAPDPTA